MSNYPDHFNGGAQDRHDRLPEDVLPADAEHVYKAQACYRAIMEEAVECMRRFGLTCGDRKALQAFGWGAEELLAPQADLSLKNLEAEGFDLDLRDDGHDQFLDRLYADLKGRPKLIDDQLRPVSTNPATRAARGEPL
jgi:hypothetical protein